MSQCLKCTRAENGLDPKTPVWCALCHRWQMLGELAFDEFIGARFTHLACRQCGRGAFCRDMWMRPGAERCAKVGHVEAFDTHVTPTRKPKDPRR